MRPHVRVLAGVLAGLLLAGCSSGSSEDPAPEATDAASLTWSPCDGVSAAQVTRIVGAEMTAQTGTADAPRCTFLPGAEGGPAFDVSYLPFDGGLDAALRKMGALGRQLHAVDVPGADAARMAVRVRRSGVAVTGFVQSGSIVQSVNAVDVTPYDEDALVQATRDLLAALVRAAPGGSSTMAP
jgi:hypothetical protein